MKITKKNSVTFSHFELLSFQQTLFAVSSNRYSNLLTFPEEETQKLISKIEKTINENLSGIEKCDWSNHKNLEIELTELELQKLLISFKVSLYCMGYEDIELIAGVTPAEAWDIANTMEAEIRKSFGEILYPFTVVYLPVDGKNITDYILELWVEYHDIGNQQHKVISANSQYLLVKEGDIINVEKKDGLFFLEK